LETHVAGILHCSGLDLFGQDAGRWQLSNSTSSSSEVSMAGLPIYVIWDDVIYDLVASIVSP
jgi:hypothetical protein